MEANAGALRRSPRPGASQAQPRAVAQTESSVTGFVLNTSAGSGTRGETPNKDTESLPPCPTTSRPLDSLAAMGDIGEALSSNDPRIQPVLDKLTSVSGEVLDVMTPAAAAAAAAKTAAAAVSSSQALVGNASPGKARDRLGEEGGKECEMSDDTDREGEDEGSTRKKRKGKVGGAAAEPLGSSRNNSSSSSSSSISAEKDSSINCGSRPRSALDDEDIDIGEDGEGGGAGGGGARRGGGGRAGGGGREGGEGGGGGGGGGGGEGGGGGDDALRQDCTQQEKSPDKEGSQQGEQQQLPTEGEDALTPGSDSSTRKRKRPEALPLPEQKAPRGNQYNLWSGAILRKVCQHRRIKGQQRVRDKDALALRLEEDDFRKGRLSPYIGDFRYSARGNKPGDDWGDGIPNGALQVLEKLMADGVVKKKDERITYEGKRYRVGPVLCALERRRSVERLAIARAKARFSPVDGAGGIPTTKHCFPRLVNIMVLDEFRSRVVESEAQASRAGLDNSAVGANRRVWLDLEKAFVNSRTEANFKISTNVQFELLNPGTCFQPHATAEKLEDMYNAVRKKLGRMRRKYAKRGVGEPFWNFCGGDTDVLYLYYAGERYPELREASDTVLAEGASDKAEMSGSSGDEGTENGAGVESGGGSGGGGGGDGDGGVGGGGGGGLERAEALKSNGGSRDSRAETQQLTQAKEAFESFVRMVGGEFGLGDPNAAASVAAGAVAAAAAAAAAANAASTGSTAGKDSRDLERMKQQAEVDLQLARLEKVREEKSVQSIAKRRQLREEYTQLRAELRKEKAEPEPDDVYIATLEEGLAAALEAMSQGNKSLGAPPVPPRR